MKKGALFLLADIGIFIYFLVLEKKKTKMCSVDSCKSSIFKKDEEKQFKETDCPVHQIQKCKKNKKHLLWGLIWKILIGKYCEDSAWAECLKLYDKKKSSKWFCLICQKIIAMITNSVVCERYLKWNHSSFTFLKSYRNLILQNWIWNLVLEIVQNEVYKV